MWCCFVNRKQSKAIYDAWRYGYGFTERYGFGFTERDVGVDVGVDVDVDV